MMIEPASNGVSEYTMSLTSWLLVNAVGYCFLVIIRIKERIMPITNDVIRITTTENFAFFGWPAPSSLDTRTLQNEREFFIFRLIDVSPKSEVRN